MRNVTFDDSSIIVGPPPQLPSQLPNRPAEAPPPLPKRDASTTGGGAPPLPKRNPSTQPTTNTEINKASQPPALPSRSSTVNQQIGMHRIGFYQI